MTPDLHALATDLANRLDQIFRQRHRDDDLVREIETDLAKLQAAHEAERAAADAEALERTISILDNYATSYDGMTGEVFGASVMLDIRENMIPAIRNLKPRSDMVCVPRHVLEELSLAIHDMEGSGMEITELLDHAWEQLTVVLAAAKEGE